MTYLISLSLFPHQKKKKEGHIYYGRGGETKRCDVLMIFSRPSSIQSVLNTCLELGLTLSMKVKVS